MQVTIPSRVRVRDGTTVKWVLIRLSLERFWSFGYFVHPGLRTSLGGFVTSFSVAKTSSILDCCSPLLNVGVFCCWTRLMLLSGIVSYR